MKFFKKIILTLCLGFILVGCLEDGSSRSVFVSENSLNASYGNQLFIQLKPNQINWSLNDQLIVILRFQQEDQQEQTTYAFSVDEFLFDENQPATLSLQSLESYDYEVFVFLDQNLDGIYQNNEPKTQTGIALLKSYNKQIVHLSF